MGEKNEFMKSQMVKDFTRDIQQYHLGPLWEAIPDLMKQTPEPQAKAYLWKNELIRKNYLKLLKFLHLNVVGSVVRFISKIQVSLTVNLGDGLPQLKRFMQLPNYYYQVKRLHHTATHKMLFVLLQTEKGHTQSYKDKEYLLKKETS